MFAKLLVTGLVVGWLGGTEAAKPSVESAKAPTDSATILDEVQTGRNELRIWRSGYVRLRSGECFYLYPLLRGIELRKSIASAERDAELMALMSLSSLESTAGTGYGQVGNPWQDVDVVGLRRACPIITANAGAMTRVRVVERPSDKNKRDYFVVDLERVGARLPAVTESLLDWTFVPKRAAIVKAPGVRGTLDPDAPLILESAGTVQYVTETKGVIATTELPRFEAKSLSQAIPTAEDLANDLRRTGRPLIRNTVRVRTWVPEKQVVTRSGPNFTERATVPDGDRRFTYEWTRETKEVVFKPATSKPQPTNTPSETVPAGDQNAPPTDPATVSPAPPK